MNNDPLVGAANALAETETGRDALADLNVFLDNRGLNLDGQNQQRCLMLLIEAWSGHAGSVLDAIADALRRSRHS